MMDIVNDLWRSKNVEEILLVDVDDREIGYTTKEDAHKYGKWIGICGELAGDTTLTETFLRMGIDELSVSPAFVLKVRDKVRNINLS